MLVLKEMHEILNLQLIKNKKITDYNFVWFASLSEFILMATNIKNIILIKQKDLFMLLMSIFLDFSSSSSVQKVFQFSCLSSFRAR